LATTGTMRSEAEPPRRGYAISNVVMFIFTPMAAFAATLATGTGWSPLVYLLGGAILGVSIGRACRRLERPWAGQLATIIGVAMLAAIVGYGTAHPNPRKLFEQVFRVDPPTGVTDLDGQVQWYDGQTILLRFRVKPDVATSLASKGGFHLDETFGDMTATDRPAYVNRKFFMSVLADRSWREEIAFRDASIYELSSSRLESATAESATMLVNESDDVWVLYQWGS
jgi:hypothetical protein